MLGYPSLRVSGIFLSLTTMSVAQIVYSLANSMQWLTGGAMGVKDISEPNIFGIEFKTQAQLYYFILVIAILLIIFSVRLAKSKYGRALKAVRDNPEAVESVGLSVTKLKLMASSSPRSSAAWPACSTPGSCSTLLRRPSPPTTARSSLLC